MFLHLEARPVTYMVHTCISILKYEVKVLTDISTLTFEKWNKEGRRKMYFLKNPWQHRAVVKTN